MALGKQHRCRPGTTQTINWLKLRTSSDQDGTSLECVPILDSLEKLLARSNIPGPTMEEVATTFDTFELWCAALNLWRWMSAEKFLCGSSCLPFDLQWFLLIFHGIHFDKFSAFGCLAKIPTTTATCLPSSTSSSSLASHRHRHRHWKFYPISRWRTCFSSFFSAFSLHRLHLEISLKCPAKPQLESQLLLWLDWN